MERRQQPSRSSRQPAGWAAVAVVVLVFAARAAAASELVPSVGVTRNVDGNGDAKLSTGLALRSSMAPWLMGELGVSYRSESRFDDQLRVKTWPVTASLYLRPVPLLYGGAGVGWYQTTYDYRVQTPLLQDATHQDFGVHVGGGMEVPLGGVGLDLNGRYVMLRDQQSPLVPEKFNPDFWTTSIGLAFKF